MRKSLLQQLLILKVLTCVQLGDAGFWKNKKDKLQSLRKSDDEKNDSEIFNDATALVDSIDSISADSIDEENTLDGEIDILLAENMGNLHNMAFDMLSEIFDSYIGEVDELFVLRNAAILLGTTCSKRDYLCKANAYKTVTEAFFHTVFGNENAEDKEEEIPWPEDFDEDWRVAIDTVREVINTLNFKDVFDVIKILGDMLGYVEGLEIKNALYKEALTSIISIAKGSTEMWSKIAGDSSSPLHKMSNIPRCISDDRKLSIHRGLSVKEKVAAAVLSDFNGAVKGTKSYFFETRAWNAGKAKNSSDLLKAIFTEAVATSAAAFTGSGL